MLTSRQAHIPCSLEALWFLSGPRSRPASLLVCFLTWSADPPPSPHHWAHGSVRVVMLCQRPSVEPRLSSHRLASPSCSQVPIAYPCQKATAVAAPCTFLYKTLANLGIVGIFWLSWYLYISKHICYNTPSISLCFFTDQQDSVAQQLKARTLTTSHHDVSVLKVL